MIVKTHLRKRKKGRKSIVHKHVRKVKGRSRLTDHERKKLEDDFGMELEDMPSYEVKDSLYDLRHRNDVGHLTPLEKERVVKDLSLANASDKSRAEKDMLGRGIVNSLQSFNLKNVRRK